MNPADSQQKKQGPRSYNHKELNSGNNPDELGRGPQAPEENTAPVIPDDLDLSLVRPEQRTQLSHDWTLNPQKLGDNKWMF